MLEAAVRIKVLDIANDLHTDLRGSYSNCCWSNSMNREHLFSFCLLELHEIYAVVTCNEGVHIDFNEIQEIEAVLQKVYSGKKFGMIANRENHYSVNPLAIKKLFSDKFLIAGAIVGSEFITRLNAEIENEIVDGAPIGFFTNMNAAIKWIGDKVGEGNN